MAKYKAYRGPKKQSKLPATSALPCLILVVLGFLFLFFLFFFLLRSGS